MIPSARCMRVAPTGYQPVQPTASYGRNSSDTAPFGWAVLGFPIPWSGSSRGIWKNDRPGGAGMAGEDALGSANVTWLDTARQ